MSAPPIPLVSGMRWLSRAVVVNHDTGAEAEVGVVDATVTVDRKSDARRVVEATITPDVDPALLRPPHRLKLWAGYSTGGVDYWAPLAHVRMGQRSLSPLGCWSLTNCLSFESLVAAAGFWWPKQIDAGASMIATMTGLIRDAVPWCDIRVDTTRDAAMTAKSIDRERWETIAGKEESIATALGVDVGCDGDGTFVIREFPAGQPSWYANEGDLLVDWAEKTDPSSIRNVWVAYSDHTDTSPVRGIAIDRDPSSPTNVARWGQSVGYYASSLLTTQDMCQHAADTRLSNTRGETVSLDMSSVPNPWADIVELMGSTRDGVATVHQLDKITHSVRLDQPLSMSTATRLVSVA